MTPQQAASKIGGKSALSRKLGLTRQAITEWGDKIPRGWVRDIEEITGIHRSKLRPDLFKPRKGDKS